MQGRSGRRIAGALLLLGTSGALFAAGQFLHVRGLDWADKFGSAVSALIAFTVLVAPLFRLAARWLVRSPAAGDRSLADIADGIAATMYRQLGQEARQRRLNDPFPMAVHWRSDSHDYGGAFDKIRETFEQVPFRRLVVVGAAGSGKSALMTRLARDLVSARSAGDPIPVVLTASTWNTDRDLRAWVAEELRRRYPELGETRRLHSRDLVTVAELLTDDGVIPIIDGLDELPDERREAAIYGINAYGSDNPIVLTSRPNEYRDAVDAAGSAISRATQIVIEPLSIHAAREYLSEAIPRRQRLAEVFAAIEAAPMGPLSTVLTNPLMLWLARMAYHDKKADPSGLVEMAETEGTAKLELHLLDSFLPAVYGDDAPWGRWRSERTLRFLARQQDAAGDGFLWWDLARTSAAFATACRIGHGAGQAVALTSLIAAASAAYQRSPAALGWLGQHVLPGLNEPATWITNFLRGGTAVATPSTPAAFTAWLAILTVVFSTVSLTDAGRSPRAFRWHPLGTLLQVVLSTAERAATGAAIASSIGILLKFFTHLNPSWQAVFWLTACGALVGSATVRTAVLESADSADSDMAESAIRDDAKANVTATVFQLAAVGAATHVVAGNAVALTYLIASAALLLVRQAVGSRRAGYAASEGYRAARVWLFLRHGTPWRMIQFLADAHRRGVLRLSGPAYQFRHVRLLQHLQPSRAEDPAPRRPWTARAADRVAKLWANRLSAMPATIADFPFRRIVGDDGAFEYQDLRLDRWPGRHESSEPDGATLHGFRVYIAKSGEHFRITDEENLPSSFQSEAAIRRDLEGRVDLQQPISKPFEPSGVLDAETLAVIRRHPAMLRGRLTTMVFCTATAVALAIYTAGSHLYAGLACTLILWVWVCLWALTELRFYRSNLLVVTRTGLVSLSGVITPRVAVLPFNQISMVRCEQSRAGVLLGYGTIRISILPDHLIFEFVTTSKERALGCVGEWQLHAANGWHPYHQLAFLPEPIILYQNIITLIEAARSTQ